MNNKTNNTNKRKGFTLVEIMLVTGFISVASIGIYSIYSKVQTSNSALQEGKNLETLKAGIKTLFGGRQNYTGLNNAVLNNARITPDSMRAIPHTIADTKITNSFGGTVIAVPYSINGGSNNTFYIRFDNVPGAVCTKLVANSAANWDGITVAGYPSVKARGTEYLNLKTLATACATDTGSGVMIAFFSS